jgi:hypothetical protein
MHQTIQHAMQLEEAYPSGAEKWYCPICSRQFIMQWEPYKKVVLDVGDEYVIHSGDKGGVQVMSTTNSETDDEFPIMSEDLRNVLEEFLKDVDFGD